VKLAELVELDRQAELVVQVLLVVLVELELVELVE